MFKRLDVVVVGKSPKRWCIDLLREEKDAAGGTYVMAEMSDENGNTKVAETSQLRKVAG
jgi:phosphoketolase